MHVYLVAVVDVDAVRAVVDVVVVTVVKVNNKCYLYSNSKTERKRKTSVSSKTSGQ